MAQALRGRAAGRQAITRDPVRTAGWLGVLLLGVLLVASGCGREPQPDAPPANPTAQTPSKTPSKQGSRAQEFPRQDPADQGKPGRAKPTTAEQWVDRLLDNHLGPLRGALDHFAVKYRQPQRIAFLRTATDLPAAMRVHHEDGVRELLTESGGWRARGHFPAKPLSKEERSALHRERQMLTAAAWVPLVRAKTVRLQGPGVLQVITEAGTTWRVAFDPDLERVQSLSGPIPAVEFTEWLTTSTTCLPQRVRFDGEELPLALESIGILPSDALFTTLSLVSKPTSAADDAGPTQRTVGDPTERPRQPTLQRIDQRLALVLEDPGSWAERVKTLTTAAEQLFDQGQVANGLPTYRKRKNRTGERAEMIVFFQPDPEQMRPFVATADQRVENQPAHDAVVFCPPAQAGMKACTEVAAARLEAYLKQHELNPAGPRRAIPFVHPMSPPTERALRRLQVRFEQPVR